MVDPDKVGNVDSTSAAAGVNDPANAPVTVPIEPEVEPLDDPVVKQERQRVNRNYFAIGAVCFLAGVGLYALIRDGAHAIHDYSSTATTQPTISYVHCLNEGNSTQGVLPTQTPLEAAVGCVNATPTPVCYYPSIEATLTPTEAEHCSCTCSTKTPTITQSPTPTATRTPYTVTPTKTSTKTPTPTATPEYHEPPTSTSPPERTEVPTQQYTPWDPEGTPPGGLGSLFIVPVDHSAKLGAQGIDYEL